MNGNFGYYDSEGKEISVYLFEFPEQCKRCVHVQEEEESVQCHITRLKQLANTQFTCFNHLEENLTSSIGSKKKAPLKSINGAFFILPRIFVSEDFLGFPFENLSLLSLGELFF